jgi:hypothetical protein
MLQGRPLLATAADAQLFVDRAEELAQLERSVGRGFNVALHGERGVGKSSLLHQLELRQRESRRVAYVEATGVDDLPDLVDRVRTAVRGPTVAFQDAIQQATNMPPAANVLAHPGVASSLLTDQVRSLRNADPTLVLVDASGSSEAAYGLFGRLRDELWQLDHRWVVAVDELDWPHLQRPPADAFFDITFYLRPLEEAELVKLLVRRDPGLNKLALAQIAQRSEGNPRRALEMARLALVEDRPIDEIFNARGMRELAAARIGRPSSMLLAELENSGEPLSPSDEALLQRLGWTRERAGQVFRELEEAGIVDSTQERQARGRPRKLYFPNPRYPS